MVILSGGGRGVWSVGPWTPSPSEQINSANVLTLPFLVLRVWSV